MPALHRRGSSLVFLLLCLKVVGGHENTDISLASNNMSDDAMSNDGDFCTGMPMSMFMDGFHRSLGHTKQKCLIYLVTGWVLDDEDKFKGAIVFSFLLALLMEVLSAVRGTATHYVQGPVPRFLLLTLIYGIQAILGYLLMFLAMTFSIEILLATIGGLCVGNLAFFRYEDFQPHRRRRDPQGLQQPLLSSSSHA